MTGVHGLKDAKRFRIVMACGLGTLEFWPAIIAGGRNTVWKAITSHLLLSYGVLVSVTGYTSPHTMSSIQQHLSGRRAGR
jgi:hypothetical protein